MKRFKSILCALCMLVPLTACAKTENEDVTITLNKTAIELTVGESEELKAMVTPSDAIDKVIEWKSDDEGVVVVDDGMLTAKGEGEAKVSAMTNGKTATCTVTVKE